jgi:CDP-glucose 4,6-dehydratase
MLMTIPSFFKDKRVFITGHTGFKGSWLSLWLLKQGAAIKGYALEPNTSPALFELLGLKEDIDSVIADIRDAKRLADEIGSFKPEIVFHLAAQPLVRVAYQEPVLTYETNVLGTAHLYEAIRRIDGIRAVVCVTSDKCYENKEWSWGYREIEALGGHDPYSASKACQEIVTASYRNSYFHPAEYEKSHRTAIASARAGNIIGGGDWSKDRLIPDCARALSKGETIIIRNPQAVRPWQHVLDPLAGYLILAQRLLERGAAYAEPWNFGPNDSIPLTVEELVRKCIAIWGKGDYRIAKEKQPHEARHLRLDASKASERLGFRPLFSQEEAISETMQWYKSYYSKNENMKNFTLRQISSYEERMKI